VTWREATSSILSAFFFVYNNKLLLYYLLLSSSWALFFWVLVQCRYIHAERYVFILMLGQMYTCVNAIRKIVAVTVDLYLGDIESRPGHGLFWLEIFVAFLSTSRKIPGQSKRGIHWNTHSRLRTLRYRFGELTSVLSNTESIRLVCGTLVFQTSEEFVCLMACLTVHLSLS
jgi:hypothetical protein